MAYLIKDINDNDLLDRYKAISGSSNDIEYFITDVTTGDYARYLAWTINDVGGTFIQMINETMFLYEI